MLRSAPGIKNRYLMHARNRAMWGARFFRDVFTADVGGCVVFQRNSWVAALLRTVVNQAVLADIEVTRAGAASPLIRAPLRDVVLESVDAGETALFHGFDFLVNLLLFVVEWFQLAAAVVNNSD